MKSSNGVRSPRLDLRQAPAAPVEVEHIQAEEAKNARTMGMLLCLDRKQRLILTLGEDPACSIKAVQRGPHWLRCEH